MEMKHAIRCEGVHKQYPHFKLNNVDLNVEQGTVMGLVGPNGAGKSTLLRIIMGLVSADSGIVTIDGHSIPEKQIQAKQKIAYVSEDMRLFDSMNIDYHIEFVKSIYSNWDDDYARDLLKRFDLNREQKIKGLSHGQRVKTTLLLALARRPKVLIFDEPTTGLDPVARKEVIKEMISALQDETNSILFSSHNTMDVENISDYITFLYKGNILESDDKERFFDNWRRLRLLNSNDVDLPDFNTIREIKRSGKLISVVVNKFDDEVSAKFTDAGFSLQSVDRLSLEEIFLSNVQYAKGRYDA